MNIKTVQLSDIRVYHNNPRINIDTIPALKRSIEKYGYNVPIVVDEEGVILAGHSRYRALIEMGVKETQVVQADLDHTKGKEYRLLDNRIQEKSEWDYDKLDDLLQELSGFSDMAELIGLEVYDNMDELIAEEVEVEDETPEDIKGINEEIEEYEKENFLCPFCFSKIDIEKDKLDTP